MPRSCCNRSAFPLRRQSPVRLMSSLMSCLMASSATRRAVRLDLMWRMHCWCAFNYAAFVVTPSSLLTSCSTAMSISMKMVQRKCRRATRQTVTLMMVMMSIYRRHFGRLPWASIRTSGSFPALRHANSISAYAVCRTCSRWMTAPRSPL